MRNRQVQIRGARRIDEQFAIKPERLLVVAETHLRGCIGRAKDAVARVELQQFLEFGDRLQGLVAPQ